jgi:dTDP-4-amino-4,6-dideoxygalactose transaminase
MILSSPATKMPIVDLNGQYQKLKPEINEAIQVVLEAGNFINGPEVKSFAKNLSQYLGGVEVIPCGNGTDALQIAYMALGLKPGDEVIMPAFNYVAAAEAASLLALKPVFIDVRPDTFNLDPEKIEAAISSKTKAIVPVHLFGQACDMDSIMEIAQKYKVFVVEDNAQAIGATWLAGQNKDKKLGTIGHIGTTSFFPSKNLGGMGDGGAVFTPDPQLAANVRKIANHGQSTKYKYEKIGINSRLDTLQAAILEVKLRHLDSFIKARQEAANWYDDNLKSVNGVQIPFRDLRSSHVFHQYTILCTSASHRNALKNQLEEDGIQSMICYPASLHRQEAYLYLQNKPEEFPVSNWLCDRVLSLPMHTELSLELVNRVCQSMAKA